MNVDTTALSIKHIAEMYCVNCKYYADLYHNKLSGYADWIDNNLCYVFYFNADNIGLYKSLHGTCLSNGEVWTFLINKDGHGGKGTLAAAIPGTKRMKLYRYSLTLWTSPSGVGKRGDL